MSMFIARCNAPNVLITIKLQTLHLDFTIRVRQKSPFLPEVNLCKGRLFYYQEALVHEYVFGWGTLIRE